MKRSFLTIILSVALLRAVDERLLKADNYFINRHKDAGYLSKVKELCEEVLAENPSDVETLWRLTRLYCTLGTDAGDKSNKLIIYEKAKGYAQRAQGVNPNSADAHFWYGVSLSRILQVKGLFTAISQGRAIKISFERALELDPGHVKAMGGLAIWYYEAPPVAGGNIDKSISFSIKGLSIDPTYTLLYIWLAKSYIKQKNYRAARETLNKCLAVKNPLSPADFYTLDKPVARKLLAEIADK